MDSYEALAAAYDELTEDVEYEKRADLSKSSFCALSALSGHCSTSPAARAR